MSIDLVKKIYAKISEGCVFVERHGMCGLRHGEIECPFRK